MARFSGQAVFYYTAVLLNESCMPGSLYVCITVLLDDGCNPGSAVYLYYLTVKDDSMAVSCCVSVLLDRVV